MNHTDYLASSKLHRDSSQSLFSQLEEIIRDGIENGVWKPGEAIPSERELSALYSLSRMTVRKAIDRMVAEGLLYRVDGKGTFVSEPKVKYMALSLAGLREQTMSLGYSHSAKLIGMEKIFATEKIASVLKIGLDAPVYLIERVVFANDVPFSLLRSYIPVSCCPDLQEADLANASLYSLLHNDYGITIKRASETLESTLATNRENLLLNVAPGSPMFLLRIVMYDVHETPIEYVKVIFRGDKVQLSLDV